MEGEKIVSEKAIKAKDSETQEIFNLLGNAIETGKKMRAAQKEYFLSRQGRASLETKQLLLRNAINLEQEFDKIIDEWSIKHEQRTKLS